MRFMAQWHQKNYLGIHLKLRQMSSTRLSQQLLAVYCKKLLQVSRVTEAHAQE